MLKKEKENEKHLTNIYSLYTELHLTNMFTTLLLFTHIQTLIGVQVPFAN